MVNSKHAFWQALVFAIFVFGIGLILGFFLENSRASSVELNILNSEVNLLDEQLRGSLTGSPNVSCELAVNSTFSFADSIYNQALELERYDAAAKFDADTMLVLHKRYDILRMMLWTESIKLRDRCDGFHIVVYFFDYNPTDITKKAEQSSFSRLLTDTKERYPDKILLIPIAANRDLASIDLVMKNYNITKTPTILIDEKQPVSSIITLSEFENLILRYNNK